MKSTLWNHVKKTLTQTPIATTLALASISVMAQVNTQASTSVNNKLNIFLTIFTGVGAVLFTAAIVFAGFKFAFEPNTKLADLKGLLIGGTLFGAAAAIAASLIS
jgi:hypothetical protein